MAFILLHPGCLWACLTHFWAQDLSHVQPGPSMQRPQLTPPVHAYEFPVAALTNDRKLGGFT